MNITTVSLPSHTRSIAARLAITAVAVAVFVAGAHGFTRDEAVTTAASNTAGNTSVWAPVRQPERPLTVYYIVSSEAERDAVLASEADAQLAREAAGERGLERDLHFFVVTNADEEQRVWDNLGGEDEFVQIVDLVHPLQAIPSVASQP